MKETRRKGGLTLIALARNRYNIYNKRVLNILPMPWLVASAQLGIGLLYVFPLWLTKLRKAPKLADGALGPLRYVAWFVCMLPRGRLAYGAAA